jgi:ABC-type glycerol-3-phosphate transport system substrate-binding protein
MIQDRSFLGLVSAKRTRLFVGIASAFVFLTMTVFMASASGSSEASSPSQSSATSASACGTSDPVTINFYSGGDVNVHDLWANDILPAYKKVCSNVTVNLVFSEHSSGDQLTFDKIAAAKQAGKNSGVDFWETSSVQRKRG